MKHYLKFLVVFMLIFAFAFSLAACGEEEPPIIDDGGGNDQEEETYRIRFVYSYTAIVKENGRDKEKDFKDTVHSIYVPISNPVLTDELIAEIDDIVYNGYSFVEWFYKWNEDTQTPVDGKEVDFDDFGEIDGDITLYGYRGNLAGASATWEVEFFDKQGDSVSVDDVAAGKPGIDVKEGTLTISGSGAMFNFANANDTDVPWHKFKDKITSVVVEEGITAIGMNSFSGLSKVKSVTLPESLVSIGNSAFSGCENKAWRYLSLPKNVKSIGDYAFSNTSFKEVVLNDGLESIGANAFYASNSMKTIVVPASLKSVGIGAFHPGATGSSTNNHALSKVYYKGTDKAQFDTIDIAMDNIWFEDTPTIYIYTEDETVGNTGAYWHYAENADGERTANPVQYCYTVNYLLPNESIPFSSQYIPVSVVVDANGDIVTDDDGIAKLEGVITADIIEARTNLTYHNMKFVGFTAVGSAPASLTEGSVINSDISYTVDRGNILSDGGGIIWSYSSGTLTISKNPNAPEGASFKMWDFADALDTGVLWTGKFSTLKEITKLVIGDGVEHIGDLAFNNLTNVTEVVLPESVTSIAPRAFSGCASLISIYCMTDDAKKIEGLFDVYGDVGLRDASPAVYSQVTASTSEAGSFWTFVTGTDGKDKRIAWALTEGGELTIGGENVMVNFEHPEFAPWYGAKDSIKSVSFASNITSIGEKVISGYAGVTSIALPYSLRVVPASAFEGTGVVNDISKYTNGLLVIDGVLIKVDATKMTKDLFETYVGISIIAGGAFDNCSAIKRVYIASSVQYINRGAFDGTNVEIVYFDGTSIGWQGIAADAGLESAEVLYKATAENNGYGYWEKLGNEYVMAGCNHEFGEWVYATEKDKPNCMNPGIETRYCIYNPAHIENRDVAPVDEHNYTYEGAEWVELSPATCYSNRILKIDCLLSWAGCECYLTKEEEGTMLPHNLPENYTPDNNSTCTEDGTMTKACQNEGCTYTETVVNPDDLKSGHAFNYYYYNGDFTCELGGTETAYCDNGCGESDERPSADYPAIGKHTFGEWISNGDTTCLVDGTETHECSVCHKTETQTAVGSAAVHPHSYTVENATELYFAGYSDDKSAMYFFKSCEWCEKKGPVTFSKLVIEYETVSAGKLPAGVTTSGFSTSSIAPTSGLWAVVLSEQVAQATNYYLNIGKIGSSNTHNLTFQSGTADAESYLYEFDYRWNGASNIRDNNPMIVKVSAGGDAKSYSPTTSDDGNTFNLYTAITVGSGWHKISYVFEKNANGDGWNMDVSVDGESKKTEAIPGTGVPKIIWETRYGSGGKNSDQSFDLDNLYIGAKPELTYANTVCEGEHSYGEWVVVGEGDCENDVFKLRVCQNEKCNDVDKVALGHDMSEYVYDGMTDCTVDGTMTATCVNCGYTHTIPDPDHTAQFTEHKMSDFEYNNDATCTEDGTMTSVCENEGCQHSVTETDPDHPMSGHSFTEYVYNGDKSCTVNGTMTATCANDCGETHTKDDPDNAATGHSFTEYVYNDDADCVTNGTMTAVCDNNDCGETHTKDDPEHPMAGHSFSEYVYDGKTDCTVAGTKTATCAKCDKTDTVEDPDHPALPEHNMNEHKYNGDATCTVNGTKTATCQNPECTHSDKVDDPDNAATGHNFADHVYNDDADCDTAGTMSAVCANGCGEIETIADPEHPALGHEFLEYYYNGDRDCTTDGTETAYCERCDATDTRAKEGYKALEHRFLLSDYETIPGSATCQHGNETSAVCTRVGCGEVDASYDDAVLDYHSFVEVKDDKYFAGYSSDLSSTNFYKSCEWCGCKSHFKFAEPIFTPDTSLSEGKLPSFVSDLGATLSTGSSIPTANGAYVSLINNNYLAVGKNNSGGESGAIRLNLDKNNLDCEQIFEFDFMWNGATPKAADSNVDATFMKFYYWDSSNTRQQPTYISVKGNTTDFKGDVKFGDKTIVCDEWNKVVMKFTPVDGGKVKITVTINGEAVNVSNSTAPQAIEQIHIHTRGDGYWTSVSMSFKNISRYVINDDMYSLTNTNCADGEHKLGDFVYNGDGTCEVDGTHVAICQNGTCTYTVSELDPEYKASGHKFENYVSNNDSDCVTDGTKTATCENGCGKTDTVVDEENLKTGEHNYSEWVDDKNQDCETDGTESKTCANCGDIVTQPKEGYGALGHAAGEFAPVENSATCQNGTKSVAYCVNGCGKIFEEFGDDVLPHDYKEIVAPYAAIIGPNTKDSAIYYKSCSMCEALSEETFKHGEKIASESFDNGTLPSFISATLSASETGGYNIIKDENGNKFWRIGKDASSGSENMIWWNFETEGIISNSLWFDFRWNGGTKVDDTYSGYAKFNVSDSQVASSNMISTEINGDMNMFKNDFTVGEWYTINIVLNYTEAGKTDIVVKVYSAEMKELSTWTQDSAVGLVNKFMIHPRFKCYSVSFDFDNVALVSEHNCVAENVVKFETLKTAATVSTPAVYYKSCSFCGAIYDDTFEYDGGFVVGQKPTTPITGLTLPGELLANANDKTTDADSNGVMDGKWSIAQSETITNAKGDQVESTYLHFNGDNKGTGTKLELIRTEDTAAHKNATFEFDFRFLGANDAADNEILYYCDIGQMDGTAVNNGNNKLGTFTYSGTWTKDDNQQILTMNGVKMNAGEWHRIKYEFVWNNTDSNYDIYVYIDGALKLTVNDMTDICFKWEIRYGGDLFADFANFTYIAK